MPTQDEIQDTQTKLNHMSIAEAEALGTSKVNKMLNMSNLTNVTDSGEIEQAEVNDNYVIASKSTLDTYGIRQEIVIQSKKEDPKVTALRKLNENCLPKETIDVEVLGDIGYKVGYGVHAIIPFIKNYQDCFMFIKDVSTEWKSDSIFISTLTLTKSRVMDEQEWSDADESGDGYSSSGVNSSSATARSIIALLMQQIGKPYVWGATGTESFDCSGLTYYCYNQFSDGLIDGKPLGRTTYDQVKNGVEVNPNDISEWQAGDLIFPHAGHVVVYLGDGKIIHAPQTGENVQISDTYLKAHGNKAYAVRRVIAPATSDNTSDVDLNNATKMSMDLSFYTGAENEGGSMSSSGKQLTYGMCASNVYPIGTKFYIKGINGLSNGTFTVEDHGGVDFDSSTRLDIYIGNGSSAKVKADKLGRQTVTVYKLNN